MAGCLLVSRLEQIGIDGIRYAGNGVIAYQLASFGQISQPLATRYEVYLTSFKHSLLLLEGMVRKVLFVTFIEYRAILAMGGILVAIAGIVTNAGEGPHVVHGPYDGFARFNNPADIFQRKHALIDPM